MQKHDLTPWSFGSSIYQIYPRSFMDTNGDGIGDLAGITAKLEYIKSLNFDAIWICPFFESPMVDFGYDVSDYRKIDPVFGGFTQFKALITKAHELNLKIIIDQVLSHTSDQHEWFKKSIAEPEGPYGDYYVWVEKDEVPNNWLAVFGGSTWTYHEQRKAYYLHNFLIEQPDLNLHNPKVQEELLDVAKFWLDLGVDGFRLDACNMYFHNQSLQDNPMLGGEVENKVQDEKNPYFSQSHIYDKSQPENIAFLSKLRELVDSYDNKFLMGEIFCERQEETTKAYSQNGYPLHSAYNFSLLVNERPAHLLEENILKYYQISEGTTWSFSNHDVTRVVSRWKNTHSNEINAKVNNLILAGLPGYIILYQGEELGLTEAKLGEKFQLDPFGSNIESEYPGRDGCRTPIPWQAGQKNNGFSDGGPWLPIPEEHNQLAADIQDQNPNSVLNYTRELLRLRKSHQSIHSGDLQFLKDSDEVLIYKRASGVNSLYFLCNLSSEQYSFSVENTVQALEKLSQNIQIQKSQDQTLITILPGGYGVLES